MGCACVYVCACARTRSCTCARTVQWEGQGGLPFCTNPGGTIHLCMVSAQPERPHGDALGEEREMSALLPLSTPTGQSPNLGGRVGGSILLVEGGRSACPYPDVHPSCSATPILSSSVAYLQGKTLAQPHEVLVPVRTCRLISSPALGSLLP